MTVLVRRDDQFRVNGLPRHIVSALVTEGRCAMCLGELEDGTACLRCGWDATAWVGSSKADHDQAHDNREG
jgi:hypothetical protein